MRRPQAWPKFVDRPFFQAEAGTAVLKGKAGGPHRNPGTEVEEHALAKRDTPPLSVHDSQVRRIAPALRGTDAPMSRLPRREIKAAHLGRYPLRTIQFAWLHLQSAAVGYELIAILECPGDRFDHERHRLR